MLGKASQFFDNKTDYKRNESKSKCLDYSLDSITVIEDFVLSKQGGIKKWSALKSSLLVNAITIQKNYTF